MGVNVPQGFRSEMAMAGDWQTLSQHVVDEPFSETPLSKGVKKRKYEGQQEDEEEKEAAGEAVVRRGWGATTKTYPGHDDASLDDLFLSSISIKKEKPSSPDPQTAGYDISLLDQSTVPGHDHAGKSSGNLLTPNVADQPDAALSEAMIVKEEFGSTQPVKPMTQVPKDVSIPVFKKRRAKAS